MRVIAGAARGRQLIGPSSAVTRPTSDRAKAALFSMLESLLAARRPGRPVEGAGPGNPELWGGLTVLDLYAGTGALGIEALSRGAAWCDFVERDATARRVIAQNLAITGFRARARVFGMDALRFVTGSVEPACHAPYGVVVMDPPYRDPSVREVIEALATRGLVMPYGLVAVEHAHGADPGEISQDLARIRVRRHGDTVLTIYRRMPVGDAGEMIHHDHDGGISGDV
jgi:16S rRNA (guanine966-N2)-methyltransferase